MKVNFLIVHELKKKVFESKAFVEHSNDTLPSWSKFQLELLGISWPPAKGWKNKVIGNELSEDLARKFLNSK